MGGTLRFGSGDIRWYASLVGLEILLIDDDSVSANLVRALLEQEGHRVHVAEDWSGAPGPLFTGRVDLALVDVLMPGIEGDELVRSLKTTERGQRTPLVLVSSLEEDELRRRCDAAGADGWVRKPLTPENVRDLVARWGSSRRDSGPTRPVLVTS